jgi:type I restriction enzyme M protein
MTEHAIVESVRKQLEELGYPKDSVVMEFDLNEGLRADLVVLDAGRPKIIVEVKSRIHLPLGRSQLELYLLKSKAQYGMLTDGTVRHCYARVGSEQMMEIPRLPRHGETLDGLRKMNLKSLTDATNKFWKIADILRGELNPLSMLREVLKVVLCKYVDEINGTSSFFVKNPDSADWRTSTKQSIETLFEKVKMVYPIFGKEEMLALSPRAVSSIVGELQSYSILQDPDSFARGLNEFAKRCMMSGEYSTPVPLAKFCIQMIGPTPGDTVLDPACGSGVILLSLMQYYASSFHDISRGEYASKLYGIEINNDIAILAKTNMVIRGDDGSRIFTCDTLSAVPSDRRFRAILADGGFNLVIVDPPFGIRMQHAKAHERGDKRSLWNIEWLFLEKAIQLAKIGGRIGIIVPEHILTAESSMDVRKILLTQTRMLAVVSLPLGMMMPYSSAKASFLLFEKRNESSNVTDARIFMAAAKDEEDLFNIARLFTRPVEATGVIRVRQSELANRWNAEYYLSTPPSVSGRSLAQLADIRRGMKVFSRNYREHSTRDTVPCIRISDLSDENISVKRMKYIDKKDVVPSSRVKKGDVLFSVTGTIGKVALVPEKLEGAVVASQIAILRSNTRIIHPKYLLFALSSNVVRKQITRVETGTLIRHLSFSELKKLRIDVPPLIKQKRILRKLNRLLEDRQHFQTSMQETDRQIEKLMS